MRQNNEFAKNCLTSFQAKILEEGVRCSVEIEI